jgi:hypothetical protein|tara:strand:- start:859 stop:1047 length:189 start_codon:yes stop_codon:yes gene_type:complete
LAGIQTILKRHFSRKFMQKWEYSIQNCNSRIAEDVMNSMGNEGWELVCVDAHTGNYTFKRQK